MEAFVSFGKVQRELASLRQVTYYTAETLLEKTRITTTHAVLAIEYAPQRLGKVCGVDLLAENDGTEMTSLEEIAADVLYGLFPCNVDALFQDILDDETAPGLYIDPVFNIGSDEFNEYVMEPSSFGDSPLTSLMVFARYLSMIVAGENFQMAIEHFRWSIDVPKCSASSRSIDMVDMDRFYKLLEEESLDEFKLPFQCCEQHAGNIFLDWTLDEVLEEYRPYNIDTIHNLVDEYAAAQPRIEEMKAAAERFTKDCWIAPRIVKAWDRCVRYKDGRVPRTLVELWGGHPVEDEFYGEIGAEADDDDD